MTLSDDNQMNSSCSSIFNVVSLMSGSVMVSSCKIMTEVRLPDIQVDTLIKSLFKMIIKKYGVVEC